MTDGDAPKASPTAPPTPVQPPPAAPPPVQTAGASSNARFVFWLRTLFGLCALAGAAWIGYSVVGRKSATDDAYVTGRLNAVSSRVAGNVVEILIDDNEHVQAGQVLARLDPKDFDVRVQLAEAQLLQAQAQSMAAQAQAKQASAALATAQASVQKTKADLDRATVLIKEEPKGISQQEYDAAAAAHKVALAAVDSARAQLSSAEATAAAAKASHATGTASKADAQLARSYTEIRAPVSGFVGRKAVELGVRVNPGQTLMYVVGDDIWVVANFKENQLKDLRIGDPVGLRIDALPDVDLQGRVDSLAPATGAQFALLPPDNATGNFTKVVQRVPVKLRFEGAAFNEHRKRVVPGLSVVVTLKTDGAARPQPSSASATRVQ